MQTWVKCLFTVCALSYITQKLPQKRNTLHCDTYDSCHKTRIDRLSDTQKNPLHFYLKAEEIKRFG